MMRLIPDMRAEGDTLIVTDLRVIDAANLPPVGMNDSIFLFEQALEVAAGEIAKEISNKNIRKLKINHSFSIFFAAAVLNCLAASTATSLTSIVIEEGIDRDELHSKKLIEALKSYSKITSFSLKERENVPVEKLVADLTNELNAGSLTLKKLKLELDWLLIISRGNVFENLGGVLKNNKDLVSLKLRHSAANNPAELIKIKHILEPLKDNTTLKKLEISGFENLAHIFFELQPYFDAILKENKTLQGLLLEFTPLSDEDIEGLAEGLKKNTSLTLLSLKFHNLTDEGVKIVANNLPENLTHLDLVGDNTSPTGLCYLLEQLIQQQKGHLEICYGNNNFFDRHYAYIKADIIEPNVFFTAPLIIEEGNQAISDEEMRIAKEINDILARRRYQHQQKFNCFTSLLAGAFFKSREDLIQPDEIASKKHEYEEGFEDEIPAKRNKPL